MIPLIPIFTFLEAFSPGIASGHLYMAIAGASSFGLLGLIYTAGGVATNDVGNVKAGFIMLAMAIGFLIFGLYLAILLVVTIVLGILFVLQKGFYMVFIKKT